MFRWRVDTREDLLPAFDGEIFVLEAHDALDDFPLARADLGVGVEAEAETELVRRGGAQGEEIHRDGPTGLPAAGDDAEVAHCAPEKRVVALRQE